MTNLEKIREMTIEELAKFLDMITVCCSSDFLCNECPLEKSSSCNYIGIKNWLEKECENNA